jgi:LuxR family transcriptional regulator, maltose regulon positive regulatory protein
VPDTELARVLREKRRVRQEHLGWATRAARVSASRTRPRGRAPVVGEETPTLRRVSPDPYQYVPPRGHEPPPVRAGWVSRESVLRRLTGNPEVPVALVVAPAGYGKTSVLTEWAERDGRPFAWIAIEEADNDPGRLLGSIAGALHDLEPIGPDVFGALSASHPRFSSAALARLGEYLRGRVHDFVLVLDDLHLLHDPGSWAVLTAVAEHLRPGSQMALGSRCDPPLHLGRLRAEGKLLELRAPDLAMSEAESAQLFAEAGLTLDDAEVHTLVDRTEGWPVGLYLASLALRDQADVGRAVTNFAGDDRIVTDYVGEELLSQLSPARIRFLMRTSVLDRLSGPLCDAVLERSGSSSELRAMSRANLLLIPLDRTDEWYRYHTLLVDTLRDELHRLEPERAAELHRRASAWYADHGDPDRAIGHALAAEDMRRAGDLIWANVPLYNTRGRLATIQRWLERVPHEEIVRYAPLSLTAAYCGLNTGDADLVARWTSVAAETIERTGADDDGASLRAAVAILRAALAREGIAQMGEDAARAYELESDESPWRALCCFLDGVAQHLAGDHEGARRRLEEGASRSALANVPQMHALCLAQLAVLDRDDTDGRDAGSQAVHAKSQAVHSGLSDYPTMALVFAAAADHHAQRGQVEEAASEMSDALRLLAMLGDDYAPWYHVEVRAVLARAALRLSDVPAARHLLGEAERYLRLTPDAVVLKQLLDEAKAQAEAVLESSVIGPSLLTTAELRVLQLLPTHLSFREIAGELYVSTNTVKTQAHAAYRKLDASSRSEAVDRGRVLGLLDEPGG